MELTWNFESFFCLLAVYAHISVATVDFWFFIIFENSRLHQLLVLCTLSLLLPVYGIKYTSGWFLIKINMGHVLKGKNTLFAKET